MEEKELLAAQIAYSEAHARMFKSPSKLDMVAGRERQEADRRLFQLFSVGCQNAEWLLVAYGALKLRLCHHHKHQA